MNAVADAVHVGYPEDEAVFAERLCLHPSGCFVMEGESGVSGYLVSHPGIHGHIPALDSLLGVLPEAPTTHYLHDIALLPEARRAGAASRIVGHVAGLAREAGLPSVSLVAIEGTLPFWERNGFRVGGDEGLAAKLRSYGAGARFMVRALQGRAWTPRACFSTANGSIPR